MPGQNKNLLVPKSKDPQTKEKITSSSNSKINKKLFSSLPFLIVLLMSFYLLLNILEKQNF